MNKRLNRLPLKALSALSLVLGLAPISILLGRSLLPDCSPMWYLPLLFAFLWGVSGYMLPQRARLPFALVGCALLIAGCAALQHHLSWQGLALLVPAWIVLLLLPPAYARPIWDEWPLGLWVAGALFHLTGVILSSREAFSGTAASLSVACAAFAFLLLLTINRHSLSMSMHGSQKAPASLRRRNLALVIVVFVLALLTACWQTLSAWLGSVLHAVWEAVKQGIAWLISLLYHEPEAAHGPMGGGSMDFSAFGEAAEPSAFAQFMEKVMMVIAAILVIVLAVFACRFLYRRLRSLLHRLLALLHRYADSTAVDYIDEAESTLHLDEKVQAFKDKIKRGLTRAQRPVPWQELDGRGRVRRLYQQYLRRHPDAQGLTAREALHQADTLSEEKADAFSALYDQARYSEHPIAAQEADHLREQLK